MIIFFKIKCPESAVSDIEATVSGIDKTVTYSKSTGILGNREDIVL